MIFRISSRWAVERRPFFLMNSSSFSRMMFSIFEEFRDFCLNWEHLKSRVSG